MNTQIKNAKNVLVVLAAMSAAVLVGVGHAAEVPARAVTYRDLNLNTEAGAKVLYQRIHGAANEVCGNVEVRDLPGVRAHEACVEKAVSDAVAAVNSQRLTQTVAMAQVR
jgi:UrcA family protein